MKRFLETFRNIWSIEDLRKRIINTLGFLLVYRVGTFIVLPGVNPEILEAENAAGGTQGLAQLINIFAGGAFSRASIFSLGIMPYISASIIMQLAGIAIPAIQKMQKEGESGRKKLNQWTRYLTVIVCVLQGASFLGSGQVPANAIVATTDLFWSFTFGFDYFNRRHTFCDVVR